MTTKQTAREVIERLPDDASWDDIVHALCVRIQFDKGVESIRREGGIQHEEAKRRLAKWLR